MVESQSFRKVIHITPTLPPARHHISIAFFSRNPFFDMESSDDDLHSVNISLQEGEDIELDLVGEGEYISDEENQNSTVDIQENLDGQDLADDADQPFAGNINETLELGVRSGL